MDNAIVYGYVNGEAVYGRDEFIYKRRRMGPITDDDELVAFAEKRCGWQVAGHKQSFIGYYLSDYALAEPYASLTRSEFKRLKELQTIAREKRAAEEAAKEWKLEGTYCYADNSVEEVWINKYGEKKIVVTVWPHGD